MILLSVSLILSIIFNILLIWYARRLTGQFLFFSESIAGLEESLREFGSHLNGVHEMEMFYGDDTLGALIAHSKDIVETVKEFNDSFAVETVEEEEDGSP
jgi:hypothetical protein